MEPVVLVLVAVAICCCCCYCSSSIAVGFTYSPIQSFLTCFESDDTCEMADNISAGAAEHMGLYSGINDTCKEKGITNPADILTGVAAGGEWGKQKVTLVKSDGSKSDKNKALMCWFAHSKK